MQIVVGYSSRPEVGEQAAGRRLMGSALVHGRGLRRKGGAWREGHPGAEQLRTSKPRLVACVRHVAAAECVTAPHVAVPHGHAEVLSTISMM